MNHTHMLSGGVHTTSASPRQSNQIESKQRLDIHGWIRSDPGASFLTIRAVHISVLLAAHRALLQVHTHQLRSFKVLMHFMAHPIAGMISQHNVFDNSAQSALGIRYTKLDCDIRGSFSTRLHPTFLRVTQPTI